MRRKAGAAPPCACLVARANASRLASCRRPPLAAYPIRSASHTARVRAGGCAPHLALGQNSAVGQHQERHFGEGVVRHERLHSQVLLGVLNINFALQPLLVNDKAALQVPHHYRQTICAQRSLECAFSRKCCQRRNSPAVLTLAPYMLMGVSNRVGLENDGPAADPSRAMSPPTEPPWPGQAPKLVSLQVPAKLRASLLQSAVHVWMHIAGNIVPSCTCWCTATQ